jgi:hypothetical protein
MLLSFLNMDAQRNSLHGPRPGSLVRAFAPSAGVLLGVLAAPLASAQEWVFDPRIELEAIYDDNYRLTDQPGQEIEVEGGALDAQLTARKQGAASLFEITPRIRSSLFPDESSEESTDYFLTLSGEKRTQRTNLGVSARFADESVVTSELLVADFPGVDLGQPVSGDAGRTSVRNRRKLYAIQPTLDFDWTERRQVTVEAHYVNAAYDNDLFEQVGYTDAGGSAGIVWDVSQRSKLAVTVLASQYSPDDNSEDTSTTGVFAEWRTAPSQVTNFYFRVGSNRAERDGTGTQPDVSSSSFNGGVGVAWNFQVTRIVLDALRSTVPSSAGEVVNRDELRFRVTRDFSPRVSGFVAARGIRTEGIDEASVSDVRDRKYYTGRTGLEWRVTRQYSLEGAYEYKWQEFQDEPNSATSNGVTLSLVYQPRRLN